MEYSFESKFVYGFEVNDIYVKLRGFDDNVAIGSQTVSGYPVYYCVALVSHTLNDIEDEIDNLDESIQQRIIEFDRVAKRYGFRGTWQHICTGDFPVIMAEDSKERVLQRLSLLDCGPNSYSDTTIECLNVILTEEHFGFLVEDAIQTKTINDVMEIVEAFYWAR